MDQWEAPDSEASEQEDEFEWLWKRGTKVLHNHWPSPWRVRTSQLVNGIFVTKDVSFPLLLPRLRELITCRWLRSGIDLMSGSYQL